LPTALTFGAAEALVLRLQPPGSDASAHLLHMLPYGVSLGVLVVTLPRFRRSGLRRSCAPCSSAELEAPVEPVLGALAYVARTRP
jgi:ABC-type uncharacterized transport system permease subunit